MIGYAPAFYNVTIVNSTVVAANVTITTLELSSVLAASTQSALFGFAFCIISNVSMFISNTTGTICGPVFALNATIATNFHFSLQASTFTSLTVMVPSASAFLILYTTITGSVFVVNNSVLNATSSTTISAAFSSISSPMTASSILLSSTSIYSQNAGSASKVAAITVSSDLDKGSSIRIESCNLRAFNGSNGDLFETKFTAGIAIFSCSLLRGSSVTVIASNISASALFGSFSSVQYTPNVVGFFGRFSASGGSSLSLTNTRIVAFGGVIGIFDLSNVSMSLVNVTMNVELLLVAFYNSTVVNGSSFVILGSTLNMTTTSVSQSGALALKYSTLQNASLVLQDSWVGASAAQSLAAELVTAFVVTDVTIAQSTLSLVNVSMLAQGGDLSAAIVFTNMELSASSLQLTSSAITALGNKNAFALNYFANTNFSDVSVYGSTFNVSVLAGVPMGSKDVSVAACILIATAPGSSQLQQLISSNFVFSHVTMISTGTSISTNSALTFSVVLNATAWLDVRFLLSASVATAQNGNFFQLSGSSFILANSSIELNGARLTASGGGFAMNLGFIGTNMTNSTVRVLNSSQLDAKTQYMAGSMFQNLPFVIASNIVFYGSSVADGSSLSILSSILGSSCTGSFPPSSASVTASLLLISLTSAHIVVEQCVVTVNGVGLAAFVQFNGTSDHGNVTISTTAITVVTSAVQLLLGAVILFFGAPCAHCSLSLLGGTMAATSNASTAGTTALQYAGQVIVFQSDLDDLTLISRQVTSSAVTLNVAVTTSSAGFFSAVQASVSNSTITIRSATHTSDIGTSTGFSALFSLALSTMRSTNVLVLFSTVSCKGAPSIAFSFSSTVPLPKIVAATLTLVQSNMSSGSSIVVNASSLQSGATAALFLVLLQSALTSGSSIIVGQSFISCSCSGNVGFNFATFSLIVNIALLSAAFLLSSSILSNSTIVVDSSTVTTYTTAFVATNVKIVMTSLVSSVILVRNTSMTATLANGVLPTATNYPTITGDLSVFLLSGFNFIGGPYSGNIVIEASSIIDSSLIVSSGSSLRAFSVAGLPTFVFANFMLINGTSISANTVFSISDTTFVLLPGSPRSLDFSFVFQKDVISHTTVMVGNCSFGGSAVAISFDSCNMISQLNMTASYMQQNSDFLTASLVQFSHCNHVDNSVFAFSACSSSAAPTALLDLQQSSLEQSTIVFSNVSVSSGGSLLSQALPSSLVNVSIFLTTFQFSSTLYGSYAFGLTSASNCTVVVQNSSFVTHTSLDPSVSLTTALSLLSSTSDVFLIVSNCTFDGLTTLLSTDVSSSNVSSRIVVYCSLWNGRRLTRGRLGPAVRPFVEEVVPYYFLQPGAICDLSDSLSITPSSTHSSSKSANMSSRTSTGSLPQSLSTQLTISRTSRLTHTKSLRPSASHTQTKTPPLTLTKTIADESWTSTFTKNFTRTVTTTLIPPTPTASDYVQQVPCPTVSIESPVIMTDAMFASQRISVQLVLPKAFKWWNSPWRYDGYAFIRFSVDPSPLPQPFGFERVLGSRLNEYNFSFVEDNGQYQRLKVVFPIAPEYSILVGETVHVQVALSAIEHKCLGPAAFGSFHVAASSTASFLSLVNVFGVVGGAVSIANSGSADAQLLALIGLSPCATAAARASASSIQYLLSPFVQYGLAAMIAGNVGLVFGVWLIQKCIAEHILLPRIKRQGNSVSSSAVPPLYAAWAKLRFPNLTFIVAMFLHQGTTAAVFVSFGSSVQANIAVGVLGLLYVLAFYIAIKHIRSVERSAPNSVRGKFILYKLPYGYYRRLFYPIGQWTTTEFRQCFGRVFGSMQSKFVWWSLYPSIMIILFNVINSISFNREHCHVQSALLAAVTGMTCVILAWRRPFRIPFTTFLSCLSLLCTTLLLMITAINVTHNSNELILLTLYISFAQTLVTVVRLAHTVYILIWERRWNKIVDDQRAAAEHSLADLVPNEHLGQILELHPPLAPMNLHEDDVDEERDIPMMDIKKKRPKWLIASELRACRESILKRGTVLRLLQHRPAHGSDMLYRLESVVEFAVEHRRQQHLVIELEGASD